MWQVHAVEPVGGAGFSDQRPRAAGWHGDGSAERSPIDRPAAREGGVHLPVVSTAAHIERGGKCRASAAACGARLCAAQGNGAAGVCWTGGIGKSDACLLYTSD